MDFQILKISKDNSDIDIIELINKYGITYFLDPFKHINHMCSKELEYFKLYLDNYLQEDMWDLEGYDKIREIINNLNLEILQILIWYSNIELKTKVDSFWDKLFNTIEDSEWNYKINILASDKLIRDKLIKKYIENIETLDDCYHNPFGLLISPINFDVKNVKLIFELFLRDIDLRQQVITYFVKVVNLSVKYKNILPLVQTDIVSDTKYNVFLNNSLNLLLEFWNTSMNDTKIKKISDLYLYSNHYNLRWIDNKTNSNKYNFINQLFFIINKLLENTSIRYIDELKYRKDEKKLIESKIEEIELELNQPPSFYIQLELNNFKKMLIISKKYIESIKKLLNSDFQYSIKSFYINVTFWFLNSTPNSVNILDNIVKNILDYYTYFSISLDLSLIKLLIKLLGENKITNNPHIKSAIISIIYNDIDDIKILFNNSTNIKELILNLFDTMIHIDKSSGEDEIYDKINPYYKSMKIIKILLDKNINTILKKSNNNWDNNSYIIREYSRTNIKKIININISTLSYSIQEMFSNIIKLYNYDNNIEEIEKDDIIRIKDKIKSYTSLTMEFLESNIILSDIVTQEYISLEIKHMFSNIINVILDHMLGDKKKCLNIKNKDEYLFNPKLLLNLTFKLIYKYINSDIFIDCLIDERYIPGRMIIKMKQILVKNDLINFSNAFELNQLSTKINLKYNQNIALNDLEIPDEFCDPILDTVIENPVYLPNTDIIMDKEVIARHLISDEHNPFNRDPLTLTQLDDYNQHPEIMEKIIEFKDKLSQWKIKNNIKY